MFRIALYARCSTLDQRTEIQLHALRQYVQTRGLEAVDEYVNHGVSGAKDRRPALDKLMADARRRRFDVLTVTKLDRLARSVHRLTSLGRELEALGIDLVVLDQLIDTSTPAGRLLFHVLGSIAEFERDLIREQARRRGCGLRSAGVRESDGPKRQSIASRSSRVSAQGCRCPLSPDGSASLGLRFASSSRATWRKGSPLASRKT